MAGKIQNEDIKSVSELTSPSSLPNDDKIYVTANSLNKTLKQAIIDGDISGGGSGKNYFSNAQATGLSVSGFNSYADAAGLKPVDGTGGSPSGNLTISVSGTNPLSGTSSILLTKTGTSNLQGEGKSIDFTIDPSDRGKVLAFTMNYGILSGTYTDDDVIIYFYDVTNSSLLEPVPYKIKNHLLTSDRFFSEIQVPYNCSSLRMIFHQSSTSTNDYVLKIDDLLFGPQAKLYGSSVTDWISYTPTGNWNTNTFYSGKWRKVGDSMEIQARVGISGGSPNSAVFTLTIPSGYSIDITKTTSSISAENSFGSAMAGDFGTGYHSGTVVYNDATSVTVVGETASVWTQVVPQTWASGDLAYLIFKVPIVGWSSSQLLSQDASTRAVAAAMTGSGFSTTASVNTKATFTTTSEDSHGSLSSSTFTAPVSGYYDVSANLTFNSAAWTATQRLIMYARINGVDYEIARKTITATASQVVEVSGSKIGFKLNAGQTVEIRALGEVSVTAVDGNFGIAQRQGPAQIHASEEINISAASSAGQSIPDATVTTVIFGTVDYSSHGSSAYDSTTGIFTAPISGKYKISGSVLFNTNSAGTRQLFAYKNDTGTRKILGYSIGNASAGAYAGGGSADFQLLAGETLRIKAYQDSGGSLSLTASTDYVFMNIIRIGNY